MSEIKFPVQAISVESNTSLQETPVVSDPSLPVEGALPPFRPWTGGQYVDGVWTVLRTQADMSQYQVDFSTLLTVKDQSTRFLEDVRPATRFPRQSLVGLAVKDVANYAAFPAETVIFIGSGATSGTLSDGFPSPPYSAEFSFQAGVDEILTGEVSGNVVTLNSDSVSGWYDFSYNSYNFVLATSGTLSAKWVPIGTETIRDEPSTNDKNFLPRPEDELVAAFTGNGTLTLDFLADEYPWRRDLIGLGEEVDADTVEFINPSPSVAESQTITVVDHRGIEFDIFAVDVSISNPTYSLVEKQTYDNNTFAPEVSTGRKAITIDANGNLFFAWSLMGVLVADISAFLSVLDDLVAWFPLNETSGDDLVIQDKTKYKAGATVVSSLLPENRVWESDFTGVTADFGWQLCFNQKTSAITVSKYREIEDEVCLSFFVNPLPTQNSGTGFSTFLSFGPIRVEIQNDTSAPSSINIYYEDVSRNDILLNSTPIILIGSQNNFVSIRRSGTSVWFGTGDLNNPVTEQVVSGNFRSFDIKDTDLTLSSVQRRFMVCDLRVWNSALNTDLVDQVRSPRSSILDVPEPTSFFNNLSGTRRYFLSTLSSKRVVPVELGSDNTKLNNLIRVQRYSGTGEFVGDRRFKQVGLGGGQVLPSPFKLGTQGFDVKGNGLAVVSTQIGNLPGFNRVPGESGPGTGWNQETSPGLIVLVNHSVGGDQRTSIGAPSITSTALMSPWPNNMEATNPAQDRLYVKGDGHVFEVSLDGDATESDDPVVSVVLTIPAKMVIGSSGTISELTDAVSLLTSQ